MSAKPPPQSWPIDLGDLGPLADDAPTAPLDVAAIRAEATEEALREMPKRADPHEETAMIPLRVGYAAGLVKGREDIAALRAEVSLQADALMRWRDMTGSDTPHAAREAIERERKVSAAWKALALERTIHDPLDEQIERDALRALGIDPEAP